MNDGKQIAPLRLFGDRPEGDPEPLQRRRPQVLDGSRKRRIARGSGTHVQEINQLLKQYQQMQKMLKGGQGKLLRRMMRQRGA